MAAMTVKWKDRDGEEVETVVDDRFLKTSSRRLAEAVAEAAYADDPELAADGEDIEMTILDPTDRGGKYLVRVDFEPTFYAKEV